MSCAAHGLAEGRKLLLPEDVDLIQELIENLSHLQELVVVDLGAGSGTTALSVFCAREKNVHVHTIDHDNNNLYWAGLAITNIGRFMDWTAHLYDSCEAPKIIHDLLLIDTSHEYEDTKRELEYWIPALMPGGYIWLHDYTDQYPGVIKAVDELHEQLGIEFYKKQGLGWSGRKI